MPLDLEKDCSFLVQVGTRSLGRGEFWGSGQRSLSEIRDWKGGCNPGVDQCDSTHREMRLLVEVWGVCTSGFCVSLHNSIP